MSPPMCTTYSARTAKVPILFAQDGFEVIQQRIAERLPPWACLRSYSCSRSLAQQLEDVQVLVPCACPRIPPEVIYGAPNLKLIAQCATGYANIPCEAAKLRGIPVCNAPGVNAVAVAESTIMMLLMLARRIPSSMAAFYSRELGGPIGIQLRGKTLGIVGMGAIGSEVAKMASGLGMKVLGVTSKSTPAELDQLLSLSHAIALLCPHTPATTGLIGEREFRLMQPGIILINFARGQVINKQDLTAALDRGQIWGVGLDTHWEEPADHTDPVYHYDNVIALPHSGTSTQQAFEGLAQAVVDNVVRLYEDRPLLNRVA